MATGTTSPVSGPAFHADDLDQTTAYSSLSVLAIVGFILGLASPFCIAAPLLMGIPLVGIAICLLAIQRIAASEGALAGRWAASAGLALCVACGIGAISHKATIRALRTHQAKDFGTNWLSLLAAGKTEEAFQLTVDRIREAPPIPDPGTAAKATTPHDDFMNSPFVKELAATGPQPAVRFDGTTSFELKSDQNVNIQQKFTVLPKSTDSKVAGAPIEIALGTTRARIPGQAYFRWLVTNYAKSGDTKRPATSSP